MEAKEAHHHAAAAPAPCKDCAGRAATPLDPAHPHKGWKHRFYTVCDARAHNKVDDCWLISHGRVYDVSPVLAHHPAGVHSILRKAGNVVDEDFDAHSTRTRNVWKKLVVGRFQHCSAHPKKPQSLACSIQ